MMPWNTGLREGYQTMMPWDTEILNFYNKYNEVDQECKKKLNEEDHKLVKLGNWVLQLFLWNLLYDGCVLVAGEVTDPSQLLLMQSKCDEVTKLYFYDTTHKDPKKICKLD